MSRITSLRIQTLALIVASLVATAGPTLAGKPSWADKGNGGKHEKAEYREHGHEQTHEEKGGHGRNKDHARGNKHFGDQHRTVVSEYFTEQFRSGHCPPGLLKNNGCLPPGQAKKWAIGQALPRNVAFYDLPSAVIVKLGPPPMGHRYVRVDNNVLLIATGTMMILDAIQDMNR